MSVVHEERARVDPCITRLKWHEATLNSNMQDERRRESRQAIGASIRAELPERPSQQDICIQRQVELSIQVSCKQKLEQHLVGVAPRTVAAQSWRALLCSHPVACPQLAGQRDVRVLQDPHRYLQVTTISDEWLRVAAKLAEK